MDTPNSSPRPSLSSAASFTYIEMPDDHHSDATTRAQLRLSQDLTGISPGIRDDAERTAELRSVRGDSIPSSAIIGRSVQHEGREELASLYPAVHARILASRNASLAEQASAGFKPAEACIQDFAVVGKVFDLLSELLKNTTEDSGSVSVTGESSRASASLLELQNLYDDALAKAAELCNSAYRHHHKHGHSKVHASRVVYAERGGKLADKYAKSARRFACAVEKATSDLQRRLGGDHAKSRWGEFLFDALVDHIVIPRIASRRGCSGADVLTHVDSQKLADYRETCGWLRSDMHNDPIAFMARNLGQAFHIAKSPATAVGSGVSHDSPSALAQGDPESNDFLPAPPREDARTDVPLPTPPRSDAGINVETRSVTSAVGDQVPRGSTDTARPTSAGRAVEDSHHTNVSIVGDINITINIGHDGVQPGNAQSIAFADSNGLSVPKEALFARLQTARAAVNSAIDLAQQRAGLAQASKEYPRGDQGTPDASTNAFFSSTRNGVGRLFSYPERRPPSSTSFQSLGRLSDEVIAPEPYISYVRITHDPTEVEPTPALATSDMLISTHSGPRLFLDVDTSKPFGGLQSPLTLKNFPGLSSGHGQSVSSENDLPMQEERPHSVFAPTPAATAFSIQPWSEHAPARNSQQVSAPVSAAVSAPVSAPMTVTASVTADTQPPNVREPRRAVGLRRFRRTESFREVSQTPMWHVSDNLKSIQDNLLAQFRRIEATAYRANTEESSVTSPSSVASSGSSFESRSGVFGRERLAQPRAGRDPGRLAASTHSRSDPSTHPTLIATNLGRQLDVKSSHLRAANPTEEMLSQWEEGAAMPASEIRSV